MTSTELPPYGPALRSLIASRLEAHERRSVELGSRRHAAVAVVVVDSDALLHGDDPLPPDLERMAGLPGDVAGLDGYVGGTAGGPALLLTRRAAKLRAHGGQWALPGGRLDMGETPIEAALREVHEELGLLLGAADVLGALDDYETRSGYVMTPVVVWGGADPVLAPDPGEVQSVHRISFRELRRPDSPRFVRIPESDRPVVQVPIGRDVIFAPTGAVLVQFRRVALDGVTERVHDYEQPVFAWQ